MLVICACPKMAWMCLRSAWLRNRWVAMAWRKLCGLMRFVTPLAWAAFCTILLTDRSESLPPPRWLTKRAFSCWPQTGNCKSEGTGAGVDI